MAKYKEVDVKKFMEVILDFFSKTENENYKKELIKNLSGKEYKSNDNSKDNSAINELLTDIRRTKYFLKNIDSRLFIEGLDYYKKVKDKNLKLLLANHYKFERIADFENDLKEFSRRVILQIEEAAGFVIKKINAWELITNNPSQYQIKKEGRIVTDLSNGTFSFFKFNSPKQLDKIELNVRMTFLRLHYGFGYSFDDLEKISFVRNKGSHGGHSDEDELRLKGLSDNYTIFKVQALRLKSHIIEQIKDI